MYGSRNTIFLIALLALATPPTARADRAADDYAVATRHYTRARWQAAIDEFTRFVERYPAHPLRDDARFLKGEALVQLGRYDEARGTLEAALAAAPDHRYAKTAEFRIGEAYFLEGRHAEADPLLTAFCQQNPQHAFNAYALPYLGEIAITAGDGARAERLYSEALRDFPEGPLARECRFGLARALESLGKRDDALRFYQFLAGKPGQLSREAQLRAGVLLFQRGEFDAALARLKTLEDDLRAGALLTEARYWTARCQAVNERWEEAAATLETASAAFADHPLGDAGVFLMAESYRKAGRADAARREYERLVDAWPASEWADDAAQILVQLAFEDEDFPAVHERAVAFAERYPDSTLLNDVRRLDGRALLKLEQFAAAVTALEPLVVLSNAGSNAALEADPPSTADAPHDPAAPPTRATPESDSADHYLLSLAYLGARRPDAALEQLDKTRADAGSLELRAGIQAARAAALIESNRYADAMEPLQAFLELRPAGDEANDARTKLIVAQAEAARFDEAVDTLAELRRQAADHPLLATTTLFLAEQAFLQDRFDVAEPLFAILAESAGTRESLAKGLNGVARIAREQGRLAEAAAGWGRLLAVAPDADEAPEAALSRAMAFDSLGDRDAARDAYAVIHDRYATSAVAPAAMLAAAKSEEKAGRPEAAFALLEQLLAAHPEFPQRDAALYELAWVATALQRDEASARAFRQLIDEHPQSRFRADALFRLAEAAAERGDPEAAARQLEPLLADVEAGVVRCHALYLRGKLAADAEDWNAVVTPMRTIVDEFGDHTLRAAADFWLAEAYYRTQRFDEAEPILARLADTDTDANPDEPWRAMVPLRRAQIAARDKEWDRAIRIATTIAERFPSFPQQYEADYLLGRCYSSQARFSEAREQFQKVIDSPTGSRTETAAVAQWMIGESYFHQKNYEEALRAYHRVEALYDFPRWQAAALLQAGKCHELQARPASAAELYQQITTEFPNTEFADEATTRLAAVSQFQPAANQP